MRKAIVTAADTSHALSLARLVNQCLEFMPDFELYVYDLGLTELDLELISPKAHIIKYDYDKYPDWHNIKVNAGEYAWKPVCLDAVVQKSDLLFWIDAGCLLKGRIDKEIKHTLEYGIYASMTCGTLAEYTHPQTLIEMGVLEHSDFGMRAAGFTGFYFSDAKVKKLLHDWFVASLDKKVFAPEGSAKHPEEGEIIHRQDQSVFNALLAKYGYDKAGQRWSWKVQDIDRRPKNIK